MGTIKDRNGKDLTETEETKKRWQNKKKKRKEEKEEVARIHRKTIQKRSS